MKPPKFELNLSSPVLPVKSILPAIDPEIGPDPRNTSQNVNFSPEPIFEGAGGIRYDFAFGFRVKFPLGEMKYRLRVTDLDTGSILHNRIHSSGELVTGVRKYFIRYRLDVTNPENGGLIFTVDYDCRGRRVYIIIPDGGLGDNLAWMPYAEEFRRVHKADTVCVIGEWLIRLVKEKYPELVFLPIGGRVTLPDAYACYFCAIFPAARKNYRPVDHQLLGMQKSIAALLGLPLENHKIRLQLDFPRTVKEPYVCISTMATNPAKYWNYPGGWNTAVRFLKRLGYRVFVMDRDHDLTFAGKRYSVPDEAEDMTGVLPISERIKFISNADFFIGLPSGLSWLAWNCGVPVVMISGFSLEQCEFPTPYRVTNFNFCHGCWHDSNEFFDVRSQVWCPRHSGTDREIECTRVITPKMVIETLSRVPSAMAKLEALSRRTIRVSFIIPAYRSTYLRETVDSVVRALGSYDAAEILLRNDASPDVSTRDVMESLVMEYPTLVRIWNGDVNLGVAASRDFLIERAKGDYIVPFDHDDIMIPFDVSRVVRFLDANPGFACSYSKKYLYSPASGVLPAVHGGDFSYFNAFFSPKVNINAMFIRRSVLAEMDGFKRVNDDKTSHVDDVYLMIRMAGKYDFHFDVIPRCFWRVHPGQQTASPHVWEDSITEEMCHKHESLYNRILSGDIPDVNGSDFRIVRGLMGAALYLHQRDRAVTGPIMAKALACFPGDPGVQDCRMLLMMMDGRFDELISEFGSILEKVSCSQYWSHAVYTNLFRAYKLAGRSVPDEIVSEFGKLHAEYLCLTPSARAAIDPYLKGRIR